MRGARIIGTGRALPKRVVKNEELTLRMDTSDEWIVQRTGVRERRYVDPGTGSSHLGVEFDEDKSWDEKREVWKISGKIYRSFNITQSAIVKDEYTTVVAAAVLVL